MKLLVTAFILALSFSAAASPSISIDNDEDDCTAGWISMDVKVSVDGEDFNFTPSCSFSFNESFKTTTGISCEMNAGMCSNFSPANKIEVSCDGTTESVEVACPTE